MSKKHLAICLVLVVVVNGLAETQSKPAKQQRQVKQPRAVLEARQACMDFQRILGESMDFDLAFEATFVKDPVRRRNVAIAEGLYGHGDLSQVDTATVVGIYKDKAQLLILMLPFLFAETEETKAELFPPPIEAIFSKKPPDDPQKMQAYAAQLKRDVADVRAHLDKVAARNPDVADKIRKYKEYLLKPIELPNRVVKPLTAYSKGRVLPTVARYYQIDECAVIREGGQMRLIGYTFISLRG